MKRFSNRNLLVACFLLTCSGLLIGSGCGDDAPEQPASLQTPRAFTIARGPVCMTSEAPFGGAVRPVLRRCAGNELGAIGLVANQTGDSVGVVDMTRDLRGTPPQNPRLVDLDPSIPGVSHIPVGGTPVGVAAGRGTTAYSVNQADASVSVINLTVLKALDTPIFFDEAPKKAVVAPPSEGEDSGTLAVALSNPSRLWLHEELQCEFPSTDDDGIIDRDDAQADEGCDAVPTQAEGQTLELPGSVSDMVVGPQGERIYLVYSDANFASVVALNEQALGDFEDGCLDGGQAPCEAARIGLTYDCSNGVDDDGDGQVDRADAQCFGPRGAESPDGIGRALQGACANGEDDDGDGQVDRDDADCLLSGADSEEAPILEDVAPACMDNRDNDADGLTDYPEDDACYGAVGRTEQATQPPGYTSASIDRFGNFFYVVDRANDQVLVVNARTLELIDAANAGGADRTAFTNLLGIRVPPSPMVVDARAERSVVTCTTDACTQGVVRYTYGAFAATSGGYAYTLNSMTTYCAVESSRDLRNGRDPAAEERCLQVPDFPIEFEETNPLCQNAGEECVDERLVDERTVAFNANFELQDAEPRESRVRGLGTCDTPREFISAIRSAAEGAVDVGCASPFRPQPVAPGDLEGFTGTNFSRASLLAESTVVLEEDDGAISPALLMSIDDQAITQETWTVTWEGVLPDTRRTDGVVSEDGGSLRVAGLDLCEAGVEEGDRLTILSAPSDAQSCAAFVNEDGTATVRTWEIAEVLPNELVLATIDEEGFADQLPSRECFNTGVRFEIRADDEWIVVGGRTGFLSQRTSVYGTCQPRLGAEHTRYDSRVETGELFVGPYLSFVMRAPTNAQGEPVDVEALRGVDDELSYRFSAEQAFQADRFRTTAALPMDIEVQTLPAARFMVVADPAGNFLYIRNLNMTGDQAAFLLQ